MSNNSKINYNEALLIESYFKSQSQNKFYINVMNNHKLSPYETKKGELITDFQNMYVRKEHGYAHIVVTYYSKANESNFREFDEKQYYYITRLQKDNELQIREDLIQRWNKEGNTSNVSVLVINEKHNKVAVIPVKSLIGMSHSTSQSEHLNFLWIYNIPENDLIWKVVPLCATEDEANVLIAHWQFLGNVAYAKYREDTFVRVVSYKNGTKSKTIDFKCMKQAYDTIKTAIDISYTTFKRRCKAEKPSLIVTDKMSFYVTTKVDFVGPDTIIGD